MTASSPAIACSLEAGDFKDRIAWIAALNARHLLRVQQDDLSLALTYDLSASAELADLVARERACCAFLTFELVEGDTTVELKVRVPDEAREATDALLGPFLGGVPRGQGPDCCGSCSQAHSGLGAQEISISSDAPSPGGKSFGTAAAAMATVALACGVCCVVPIALPGLALGGLGAALAWFGNAHTWVAAIAAVFVVVGWVLVYRDATRRKARPGAKGLWVMGIASLVLVAAIGWPRLEPTMARIAESAAAAQNQ